MNFLGFCRKQYFRKVYLNTAHKAAPRAAVIKVSIQLRDLLLSLRLIYTAADVQR